MRSSEAAVPGLFSTRVSDFVDPDDETGEIGAILLSQVDRLKVAYTRCQLFRNSAPKVAKWHFSKPSEAWAMSGGGRATHSAGQRGRSGPYV
jgi:hypothetical protein